MQTPARRKIRSRRIEQLEAQYAEPIENLLRHLYYDQGLTLTEIGVRLEVPYGTIATWMIRLGINQRAMAHLVAKEQSA